VTVRDGNFVDLMVLLDGLLENGISGIVRFVGMVVEKERES